MTGEAAAPPQEVDGTGGDGGPTLGLHLMADGEAINKGHRGMPAQRQ